MYDRWHYLIGTQEQLEPVWQTYFVGIEVFEDGEHAEIPSDELLQQYGLFDGLDDPAIQEAKSVIEDFGGGYDVAHSTPVWLIDAQGQIRVKHGQDLIPARLVDDIRQLF